MAAIGITTGVDLEMAPILGELSSTSFMFAFDFGIFRNQLEIRKKRHSSSLAKRWAFEVARTRWPGLEVFCLPLAYYLAMSADARMTFQLD